MTCRYLKTSIKDDIFRKYIRQTQTYEINSFYSRIFFADSFRITCIGMATPIARDIIMNNVLAPLLMVSESMVL